MTLADFFLAVNSAGIRLANVAGRLELRGPPNAIGPQIKAGAAEHKAAILALLPPAPEEGESGMREALPCDPAGRARSGVKLLAEEEGRREHASVAAGSDGGIASAPTAEADRVQERLVHPDGPRHDRDWSDWRLEWLRELGVLSLRMRGCQDPGVLERLRALAETTPTSLAEWLALGQQIADTEYELRRQGKLPSHPWPERGEP